MHVKCIHCVLSSFSIYLVTVTSQAVGGNTETLCAHINEPKEMLSIVVTLRTNNRNLTILQQDFIKNDFYKCVPFKVSVQYTVISCVHKTYNVTLRLKGLSIIRLYNTVNLQVKP